MLWRLYLSTATARYAIQAFVKEDLRRRRKSARHAKRTVKDTQGVKGRDGGSAGSVRVDMAARAGAAAGMAIVGRRGALAVRRPRAGPGGV